MIRIKGWIRREWKGPGREDSVGYEGALRTDNVIDLLLGCVYQGVYSKFREVSLLEIVSRQLLQMQYKGLT